MPRGRKDDKRIFLSKGGRVYFQSHRKKIRKSYTKQGSRLFPSRGMTCEPAKYLNNKFLSQIYMLIISHQINIASACLVNALEIRDFFIFWESVINWVKKNWVAVPGGLSRSPRCSGKMIWARDWATSANFPRPGERWWEAVCKICSACNCMSPVCTCSQSMRMSALQSVWFSSTGTKTCEQLLASGQNFPPSHLSQSFWIWPQEDLFVLP